MSEFFLPGVIHLSIDILHVVQLFSFNTFFIMYDAKKYPSKKVLNQRSSIILVYQTAENEKIEYTCRVTSEVFLVQGQLVKYVTESCKARQDA